MTKTLDSQIEEYRRKVLEEENRGRYNGTAAHIRLSQLLEIKKKARRQKARKNITGTKGVEND